MRDGVPRSRRKGWTRGPTKETPAFFSRSWPSISPELSLNRSHVYRSSDEGRWNKGVVGTDGGVEEMKRGLHTPSTGRKSDLASLRHFLWTLSLFLFSPSSSLSLSLFFLSLPFFGNAKELINFSPSFFLVPHHQQRERERPTLRRRVSFAVYFRWRASAADREGRRFEKEGEERRGSTKKTGPRFHRNSRRCSYKVRGILPPGFFFSLEFLHRPGISFFRRDLRDRGMIGNSWAKRPRLRIFYDYFKNFIRCTTANVKRHL